MAIYPSKSDFHARQPVGSPLNYSGIKFFNGMNPRWSPNSKEVVFISQSSHGRSIEILEISSGIIKVVIILKIIPIILPIIIPIIIHMACNYT